MAQKPNRKKWLISQLRRLSMKWPPRNRVYKANRRELPRQIKKDGTPYKKAYFEHQCNSCKEWFRASNITMDHIEPVVDIEGYSHLSDEEFIGKFASSLFCYEENWQKLCTTCHDNKTKEENKKRKSTKKVDKSVK